jgi:hypothetical protein
MPGNVGGIPQKKGRMSLSRSPKPSKSNLLSLFAYILTRDKRIREDETVGVAKSAFPMERTLF